MFNSETWPKAMCAQGKPEEPFRIWGQTSLAYTHILPMGFPGGSDRKESTFNVGELGSAPGLGRSPEEKNNYPQYSCLENSMGKGWQAIVYGVAKHRTQLSDFHLCFPYSMFLTDLQSKLERTDKQ